MNEAERRIGELIEGLDADSATREEVARAAEELVALGKEGVARLVRSMLRRGPPHRDKAAMLLACLKGQPARWALAEIERILDTTALNATEQMWLTILFRRLADATAGEDARTTERAVVDSLLDDETELLLWRDEFASLPTDDQLAVLAPILQEGNPAVLRLLEVAMSLRIPQVDEAIAAGLARFATPDALPLLRELLRRPDPSIRKQAMATVVALERQGVATRDLFVAETESQEPVRAAFATAPRADGRMAVLIARGRTPGQLRLVGVIVDPVEAGIAAASGEAGLTEADLQGRLNEYARSMGQRLVRVDANMAQSLVAAAEEYAHRQRRPLPADYLVWRRYFGSPRVPAPLPIIFGPTCSQCGARIRSGDLARGGIIAGRAALCARCTLRHLTCSRCGRLLDRYSDTILAREGGGGQTVDFLCNTCAKNAIPRAEG